MIPPGSRFLEVSRLMVSLWIGGRFTSSSFHRQPTPHRDRRSFTTATLPSTRQTHWSPGTYLVKISGLGIEALAVPAGQEAASLLQKEPLPDRFNEKSELEVVITHGGTRHLAFDLSAERGRQDVSSIVRHSQHVVPGFTRLTSLAAVSSDVTLLLTAGRAKLLLSMLRPHRNRLKLDAEIA